MTQIGAVTINESRISWCRLLVAVWTPLVLLSLLLLPLTAQATSLPQHETPVAVGEDCPNDSGKQLSFWTTKSISWTLGLLFLLIMAGIFIKRNATLNRLNQRLKKSEAELAAIYQNAPLVMLLVDSKRQILKLNDLATAMAKRPDSESIGCRGGDVLHCVHANDVQEGCGFGEACQVCGIRNSVMETLETGENISRRDAGFSYQLPDGQQQVMNILVSTTFLEINNESHVLICFEDITEQKMLEKQLRQSQKMEAIGTLAGGIAHDFNNILSAILGYGEIAMEETKDGSLLQEDIGEILKAGHRASDLVQQILAFSRQREQEFMPLQIQFIVKEAVKMLQASLPSTISINVDIDASCPAVMADATQIHQIMLNLCTNAKQAMLTKGGELTIALHEQELPHPDFSLPEEAQGAYLLLMARDTGSGMDEQTLEKIFDPFFTTKRVGEGTGLGLAVVHGIVKSHHGFLLVESAPEQGTTFRIFLPLADDPSVSLQSEDGQHSEELSVGNKKLMLVDDEPHMVEFLSRMLKKKGCHVKSFSQSSAALSHWQEDPERYDLLISDVTMPEMTGVELAEEILAQRPGFPIILLTGYSEIIDKEQAEAIGVRDLLMKPIDTGKLLDRIQEVFDHG